MQQCRGPALAFAAAAGAITNGGPDGGAHPSVGAVLAPHAYSDGTWEECSGTLISPQYDAPTGRTYWGTWHGDPQYNQAQSDPHDVAVGSVNSLNPSWIRASMNPATGDGGTCYGDSGGPNFLGGTNILAGTTTTGDFVCRATNVDYRMDTFSAQSFLGGYVTLP